MSAPRVVPTTSGLGLQPIRVEGKSFALNGNSTSYRFHVDEPTGELRSDHFGGLVSEDPISPGTFPKDSFAVGGWQTREFPDLGRGDFRNPAFIIRHEDGFTVSAFRYQSHTVIDGKPGLEGLPATFGEAGQVSTLVVHMVDEVSSVAADLSYSVFPEHDAIVRSVKITNQSKDKKITVERLNSFSVDFPVGEYDVIGLHGDWCRERKQFRRRVDYGTQGFQSNTGYSSHFFNPFLAVVSSTTTESQGDAWGFSLVYTGSFAAEVEKGNRGLLRTSMGMNSLQFSWPLAPGESLTSPECVAVYSDVGLGAMSRKFHRLYRRHLIKSRFVNQPRPPLLNSWEGLYFNYDEERILKLAESAAGLSAKLFVLDDGWFGVKHPRLTDNAGLGDWKPNPDRFPNGLSSIVDKVSKLDVAGSESGEKLQFGIWVEPEMVNPKSELYENHPEWVMSAGSYPRTEARDQLVLNVGLVEVQDYIIECIGAILEGKESQITYVKWDNNRAIHESPSPESLHRYMLGAYRVWETLTSRFPHVLWEGCSAGGGRFDPGTLQYFPQVWTSDSMDPLDRLSMQFGTSLVYPPSTMGAHVGAVPSHVTKRTQSFEFRAHVALMGGSFGFELDPEKLPEEERSKIPELIRLAERIGPIVINGDLWRLRLPEECQDPAALIVSEDGSQAVLFAFRLIATVSHETPYIKLQGLEASAKYKFDGAKVVSGATLMNGGIKFDFNGDYDSRIIILERV